MSVLGGCHHHPEMQNESYSSAPNANESPCDKKWHYTMAPSDSPQNATGSPDLRFPRSMSVVAARTAAVEISCPMKRRGKARRKERRRTENINSAFAELRDRIPNVPADTKLSKIKTLRLATSYIAYLMDVLDKNDQNGDAEAFKTELIKTDFKEDRRMKELNDVWKNSENNIDKKTKGRTGWPQYVWALVLKH